MCHVSFTSRTRRRIFYENCRSFSGTTEKKKSLTDVPSYADQNDTWVDRRCPPFVVPYLKLARIDRPVGTWLLLWPCLWSQTLASTTTTIDPLLMLKFGIGAFVMRGAGCTINDMWDRDIDGRVARTRDRPLAAGTISVPKATMFLAAQLSTGLGVLCTFDPYTIALASSSLILVGAYPLAKRYVSCPQAVLGLTFNWGALVGWTAVRGAIETPALFLYTGCFFWTMLYDTLYAHQDKEDDARVGVNSSALWLGDDKTYLYGFGGAAVASWMAAGMCIGAHAPYYVGVTAAAVHLQWQIYTARLNDRENLATRFKSNSQVGALVFGGAVVGHLFS